MLKAGAALAWKWLIVKTIRLLQGGFKKS